jgi:hypothetical protein
MKALYPSLSLHTCFFLYTSQQKSNTKKSTLHGEAPNATTVVAYGG